MKLYITYKGIENGVFYAHNNATIEKRPPKENVTTLSYDVWKLKDQKILFNITWAIRLKALIPFQVVKYIVILCIYRGEK